MTPLQELLDFIGKYKYLRVKCNICEKTFFCSGSCLKKVYPYNNDEKSILWGEGCLCYDCDFSSEEYKVQLCKKGEPFVEMIRILADNQRRKRNGKGQRNNSP